MTSWGFQIRTAAFVGDDAKSDLATAANRTLVMHKNDAHEASWTLERRRPDGRLNTEVGAIVPVADDVVIYRDLVKMARLRVTHHSISGDGDHVKVTYSASSYKNLLKRRFILDADVASATAHSLPASTVATGAIIGGTQVRSYPSGTSYQTIAFDLIQMTQTRNAFDALGITVGTTGTAISTSQTTNFAAGTSIYDAIELLAAGSGTTTGPGGTITPGFEWDIDADLKLQIWPLSQTTQLGVVYPMGRGQDQGYLADYGGTVASFERSHDTSNFANVVRTSVSVASTVPRTIGSGDGTVGRWEAMVAASIPNLPSGTPTQVILDALAVNNYLDYGNGHLHDSYTLTLRAGAWGIHGGVWDTQLGDLIRIVTPGLAGIEALDVGYETVNDITFNIGDDGDEVVALSLGSAPALNLYAAILRARNVEAQLAKVENLTIGQTG